MIGGTRQDYVRAVETGQLEMPQPWFDEDDPEIVSPKFAAFCPMEENYDFVLGRERPE